MEGNSRFPAARTLWEQVSAWGRNRRVHQLRRWDGTVKDPGTGSGVDAGQGYLPGRTTAWMHSAPSPFPSRTSGPLQPPPALAGPRIIHSSHLYPNSVRLRPQRPLPPARPPRRFPSRGTVLTHPSPAPPGRELYRKGLKVTRHLLTIIFPSGLTAIMIRTCPGEQRRARQDAPSWVRLSTVGAANPPGLRARGAVASRLGPPPAGSARPGRRGTGRRGCRRAARAPSRAVSASPPPPRSHFRGRKAARPQTAGRATACSGSLAGRDGAPARRGGTPWRAPASPVPARGGPGPAAPLGRAGPRPRAAPRPWPSARRARRPPARSRLSRPRSGVRRPIPRRATPAGAALFPRRRRPSAG